MLDPILICMYCGDVSDYPSESWVEKFGVPDCCDEKMLQLERNKVYDIHKGIDNLKKKLEEFMLEGMV